MREPSVLQMSRQVTKYRGEVTDALDADVSKLSISNIYDGEIMYEGKITCGISSKGQVKLTS